MKLLLLAIGCTVAIAGCSSISRSPKTAEVTGSAAPPILRKISGPICPANEKILYACVWGVSFESLCVGDQKISYRRGNPRYNGTRDQSVADWSNIRIGHVIGGGGGHQTHVRFIRPDGYNVLVLEGAPGQYHDGADGPWSGITMVDKEGKDSSARCTGKAFVAPDWLGSIDNAAPSGLKPLMEEEGSFFDGWF